MLIAGSQHHIFPSVSKINLSGSHDFMLRQLDSLKDLAVKPNYTEAMIAERKPTCPICGTGDQVVLTSKSAISDHIYKSKLFNDCESHTVKLNENKFFSGRKG